MQRIAEFQKVSFEQFKKDFEKNMPQCGGAQEAYNALKLPQRATAGSAGYDFYAPADIELCAGESVLIPTGIRAKMQPGWVLQIFPRSGLGFKHRVRLDNTVGIIDEDYYGSSNEGHIMVKFSCEAFDGAHTVSVKKGEGFAQGIFVQFGITVDDSASAVRDGGFGSTTK